MPRRAITSISRMRSEHSSLNVHLHRLGVVESQLCRRELTNEGLDHVLLEYDLNKNRTQMLTCEISKSIEFPINSDYLLCLWECNEKVAMALQRFILRVGVINI